MREPPGSPDIRLRAVVESRTFLPRSDRRQTMPFSSQIRKMAGRNRRSGRRQQGGELLERLIGCIGALSRRGIDELVDGGAEVDHDLVFMLIVAVELHANDVVLAGADLLERRSADQRIAKVGTVGHDL